MGGPPVLPVTGLFWDHFISEAITQFRWLQTLSRSMFSAEVFAYVYNNNGELTYHNANLLNICLDWNLGLDGVDRQWRSTRFIK
jgi:hypothetical protein